MPALLRSSQSGQEDIADGAGLPNDLRVGEAEIDFRSYEARVGGNLVEMTRNEFAVLRYLTRARGPGGDARRFAEPSVG